MVGPSGAGKDTLIQLARARFAGDDRVVFARRLITRGPDAHEDHIPIDREDLRARISAGEVALNWSAHGLDYAVPSSIDAAIAAGQIVIVNVSRRIIAEALAKYARVVVVVVTAPADILAERLKARGRETSADVAGRLERRASDVSPADARTVVIENVGRAEIAAARLIALIGELAPATAPIGGSAELPQQAPHF
jgi:ribose 1,5-bisphosphokinase